MLESNENYCLGKRQEDEFTQRQRTASEVIPPLILLIGVRDAADAADLK